MSGEWERFLSTLSTCFGAPSPKRRWSRGELVGIPNSVSINPRQVQGIRQKAEELAARPPLEEAREFLGAWVATAGSLDEAGEGFRHLSPLPVARALKAIETLLAEPQREGVLANLVGWDANWVLDDPSDAGAADFLRQVAQLMRQALDAGR